MGVFLSCCTATDSKSDAGADFLQAVELQHLRKVEEFWFNREKLLYFKNKK